jgi:hypothetical protein
MLRFTSAIALACLFSALLLAQQPQEPGSAGQEPDQKNVNQPAEQKPADQTSSGPAKSGYPLDAFTNFSAIMKGSFVLDDPTELHIYRSNKMMRVEGSEGVGYYLTDLEKQNTIHVWDDGCAVDNHVYQRSAPWAAMARPGYKAETVARGKETVDGHLCQVEDVTITGPDLQKPLKLKLWEAEDLKGFPIKIESVHSNGHNKTIRYSNVVVGPQDRTLFFHPKSCQAPVQGPMRKVPAPRSKPQAAAPAGVNPEN